MEAFFLCTGIVALAEIGDKTQLLAFVLAARFQRPWPIIWGILVATLLNHALAGAVGAWVMSVTSPQVLRWILAVSFLLMAVWMLVPDKLDDKDTAAAKRGGHGIFITTFIAFFLAEMGDKTQIATIALAAKYADVVAVVLGTTLGMMIANVPAVLVGGKLADKLPVRAVHVVAALIFAVLGILLALNVGGLG